MFPKERSQHEVDKSFLSRTSDQHNNYMDQCLVHYDPDTVLQTSHAATDIGTDTAIDPRTATLPHDENYKVKPQEAILTQEQFGQIGRPCKESRLLPEQSEATPTICVGIDKAAKVPVRGS